MKREGGWVQMYPLILGRIRKVHVKKWTLCFTCGLEMKDEDMWEWDDGNFDCIGCGPTKERMEECLRERDEIRARGEIEEALR